MKLPLLLVSIVDCVIAVDEHAVCMLRLPLLLLVFLLPGVAPLHANGIARFIIITIIIIIIIIEVVILILIIIISMIAVSLGVMYAPIIHRGCVVSTYARPHARVDVALRTHLAVQRDAPRYRTHTLARRARRYELGAIALVTPVLVPAAVAHRVPRVQRHPRMGQAPWEAVGYQEAPHVYRLLHHST